MSCQIIEDMRPFITTLDRYTNPSQGISRMKDISSQRKPSKDEKGQWMLDLKIVEENRVVLKDRHCPICKIWLSKNGINNKVEYNENTTEKYQLHLQRYLCPDHGEIHINYAKISQRFPKYSTDLQRSVRLVFSLGIPPSKIQNICIALRLILIPLSTIKSWIYPLKTQLKPILYPRKMPCSGSLIYDEIHLKLEGRKGYLLSSIDNYTRLVIRSDYSKILDKKAVKSHFVKIKSRQKVKIDSVVHDGATVYGSVFKDRSLKKIAEGRCHTHFKKSIRSKIYKATGLGKQLQKPLPRGHFRFLRMLYWTVNSPTEFDFFIRLEAARSLADTLKNDKLPRIVNWVGAAQKYLLNHLYHPHLAKTTNAVESLHNEIEVYRVFKVGQKTGMGIEFVANSRIFIHNLRELNRIKPKLDKEQDYLNILQENFGYCAGVRARKNRFARFRTKIYTYQKELEQFWNVKYPKKALPLFKQLWAPHH